MNKSKTCFITGANSGIGKEAAIQIAQRGYQVFIGSRNKERGENALKEIQEKSGTQYVKLILIDLSSQDSIHQATKSLKSETNQLDVLIHNAADFDIARKKPVQSIDGIESIWATNHLGPVLLTNECLELLENSDQGRIITIASQGLVMHPRLKIDLDDPEFKKRKFSVPKAYYQSKLAQVMYTYWLADQLKDSSITANCIRVTNVKIDVSRYPHLSGFMKFLYKIKSQFSISPEEMAKTYTYLATVEDLSLVSGKYFNEKNQQVKSSAYSSNEIAIENLMALTKTYLQAI